MLTVLSSNSGLIAPAEQRAAFTNPAIVYMTRLSSAGSKRTVLSTLKITANLLGYESIHSCPWHELKRPHVQQVIFKLGEKGLSPATQNGYLSAIKGVCEEAWMLNQMTADDFQKINKIRSVKGTRLPKGRALKPNEVTALIDSSKTGVDYALIRDRAIIMLLFGCGLRKAELISLLAEDFDYESSSFKVIGKGNKQELVFMPSETLTAVIDWMKERGRHPGALFTKILRNGKITGRNLTGQGITYILNKRREIAKIQEFAPHDTRRTFATRLFENGIDALIVQKSMRHSNLETTRRYDLRGSSHLKNAIDSVDFFGTK